MQAPFFGLLLVLSFLLPLPLVAQQPDETVYEAGSGVSLPRVITQVKPEYTSDALAERVQGEVLLQAVVTTDGMPTKIEVKRSLDERLDRQAIAALEQWRFAPGEKDGKAVAVRIAVELTFRVK